MSAYITLFSWESGGCPSWIQHVDPRSSAGELRFFHLPTWHVAECACQTSPGSSLLWGSGCVASSKFLNFSEPLLIGSGGHNTTTHESSDTVDED